MHSLPPPSNWFTENLTEFVHSKTLGPQKITTITDLHFLFCLLSFVSSHFYLCSSLSPSLIYLLISNSVSSLTLLISSLSIFISPFFYSHVCPIVASLFLFSMTITMIAPPVVSLSLTCPECQSAWAVPIPCRANMFAPCKKHLSFRATWNEVGLCLCWKE